MGSDLYNLQKAFMGSSVLNLQIDGQKHTDCGQSRRVLLFAICYDLGQQTMRLKRRFSICVIFIFD